MGRIGEAFGRSTARTPRIASGAEFARLPLPLKPFACLTKCLFPRNTDVLEEVMVIAFGDLIKRARHPTGLTIARIKTTSGLICTRRSRGVRSRRTFGRDAVCARSERTC
jgi:hypothetical protein